MQPINVAVVNVDQQKRAALEHFLQQDKENFTVMSDASSGQDNRVKERRLKSRVEITLIEDNLARIKRLKPRILLVDAQYFLDADCTFFVQLRRKFPKMLVILLADESIEENKIMQALASGVRGFLSRGTDLVGLIKATQAIEHGEAWVPRKMLGKIMHEILYADYKNPVGA